MVRNVTVDPVALSQQAVATAPALQPQALELMIMCAAHNRQFFDDVVQLVKPEYFKQEELPLKLLLEAVYTSVQQYHGVSYQSLSSYFQHVMSSSEAGLFSDQQLDSIFRADGMGLLWWTANPDARELSDTNVNYARAVLQRFVYERTVVLPLRNALNPALHNGGVPESISDLLKAVTDQQSRITALHQVPSVNVAPAFGSPMDPPSVFRELGLPFLASALQGQRDGDCNGLLGPTGGGKTTTAIQMAVAAAKVAWEEAQISGTAPKKAVFVTYEEDAMKILPRVWSSFCQIDREVLESLTDWSTLSTQATLKDYERQLQRGEDVLSEQERYMLYSAQLQQCFVLLDFSGSEAFPDAGNGYVPEIASCLDRMGVRPYSIFIDYAGLMCDRYLESKGTVDKDASRKLLKACGDNCRKQLSERFGCTTWLLHQLKGAAGEYPPTKLIKHTDAAECRDFAVNLAVCMCLGTPDEKTGCRRLNFSKVRYRSNEVTLPVTLRPHDKLAEMCDVTRDYTVDETSRRFLTASEAHTVHGAEAASRPRAAAGIGSGLRPVGIRVDYASDGSHEGALHG